ncbi:MAG: hypothetical protein KF746_08960 [Chitinophagaceae bacterium]|nr:hypothetical protein [Chitinophagaceae bacterium]
MCRFKNWYQDENGYVIQCEDCRHFQVSFGTSMLTFDEAQFKSFIQLVSDKKANHALMHNPDCKCIILPTPCSQIHLILSENEFMNLHEMIQAADTEIQTRQLLNFFHSK